MTRPGISYAEAQQLATGRGVFHVAGRRVVFPIGDVARSRYGGMDLNASTLTFHPDGTVVLTIDTSARQDTVTLIVARDILQVGAGVLGASRRRVHWQGQTFRERVAIDADGHILTDMAARS